MQNYSFAAIAEAMPFRAVRDGSAPRSFFAVKHTPLRTQGQRFPDGVPLLHLLVFIQFEFSMEHAIIILITGLISGSGVDTILRSGVCRICALFLPHMIFP